MEKSGFSMRESSEIVGNFWGGSDLSPTVAFVLKMEEAQVSVEDDDFNGATVKFRTILSITRCLHSICVF